jgi:hypothetical protein
MQMRRKKMASSYRCNTKRVNPVPGGVAPGGTPGIWLSMIFIAAIILTACTGEGEERLSAPQPLNSDAESDTGDTR